MSATEVKRRKGTAAQCDAMTPANAEIIVDTTNYRTRIGDASLAGGFHQASANDVQRRNFTYATAGGTANAITLTLSVPITSYTAGVDVMFKATADNTSDVNININSVGNLDLLKMVDGSLVELDANDIRNGGLYHVVLLSGSAAQLMNPPETATSSGLVLLDTKTASSSSTLNFTAFSSTYDNYLFKFDALIPSTGGAFNFAMRTSTNGGSSYDSGSSYAWVKTIHNSGSTTTTTTASDSSTAWELAANNDLNTGQQFSGDLELFDVNNSSNWTSGSSRIVMNRTGGGSGKFNRYLVEGGYFGTTVVNAVQFLFTVGNITSGKIYMYGYSK